MRSSALLYIAIVTCFCSVYGQLKLYIPPSIEIFVDDSTLNADQNWLQGLRYNLGRREILHSIAGFHADEGKVYTKIRLPQTLTRAEVVENLVLYYCLFDNEEKREAEQVLVYPLFTALNDSPHVTCTYRSPGKFTVRFHKWEHIPLPAEPSSPEKEVYNLVLQIAFGQSQNLDSVPEGVFEQAAQRVLLDADAVRRIYEKVYLWKQSPRE